MKKSFKTQPDLFVASAEWVIQACMGWPEIQSCRGGWDQLEKLMAGIYGSKTGRPSYPLLTLLRSLLLGIWYGLSDEQLESCLARDLLFRHFCHLELTGNIPDLFLRPCRHGKQHQESRQIPDALRPDPVATG